MCLIKSDLSFNHKILQYVIFKSHADTIKKKQVEEEKKKRIAQRSRG